MERGAAGRNSKKLRYQIFFPEFKNSVDTEQNMLEVFWYLIFFIFYVFFGFILIRNVETSVVVNNGGMWEWGRV